MTNPPAAKFLLPPYRALVLAICAAAMLCACGGDGEASSDSPTSADVATGTMTLQMNVAAVPAEVATLVAEPMFHTARGILNAPDDSDTVNNDTSAHRRPHRNHLPSELSDMSSRRLTVQDIESHHPSRSPRATSLSSGETVAPNATSSVIATYTPAQIRAAYGFSALPAYGATLSAAQAAQMGAGATIYIVDAYNDPNVAAELAAFNQKFGLPTCTTRTVSASSSLPLAPASTSNCELLVVYSTASGTMTSTPPVYNAGWSMEIALDVQWAHATAPLARIVLIEAADASISSLLGGVQLANAMGPGAVSMSFGTSEGNWTASVDSAFTAGNMVYLAATGDSGAAVAWPSVSSRVLAVGGTTLTYTGSAPRSEASWSGTGGGISLYTATPSYQSGAVPGVGVLAHRAVADVAFNADPASGQYVAVLTPGSSAVSWLSLGGTSLSTPQWAGLVAIANATRTLAAKPVLSSPHSILYGQIAAVPASYASVFSDIAAGSNGSCSTCTAKAGYDPVSGLGTPNASSLLSALSGAGTATSPVVTSATINGTTGTALSFTVSTTAANPVTYTLSGAPVGMSISGAGVVVWATPLVGSYTVTVTVKDSVTGLSGQGTYKISIVQQTIPVVGSGSVTGMAGTALSFTAKVTAANPVTYSLTGAPAGMTISTAGTVSWPKPVAGAYSVTVVAKDTKTGLSGQGVYTIAISSPVPPVVTSATVSGKPGTALSFSVSVTASNPVTYTLTGAPSGMSVNSAGVVSWAAPLVGTYAVTVTAKDSVSGLTGQGLYTIKVAAAGPVITAQAMTGVAGKVMTGTIAITDPGATYLSISITGVPLGMTFSVSGMTITATWTTPVLGNYVLKVVAVDQSGLSAQLGVPITVTAK